VGFFGSLTGSDQKKDLKKGKKASDAALKAGYEGGNQFFGQAADLYNPYVSQGTQANTLYGQALGLGTPEEQVASQQRFFQDPAMQAVLGQQSNALLRKFNAGGSGTGGGKLALAGTRVGLENYNNYLNRLQGMGTQGLQATGAQAGVRQDQGNLRYGYGASLAGQETNFSNAMAANRTAGVNNLLNAAGSVAGAAMMFSDIRLKHDIEYVGTLPSGLPVYDFTFTWGGERQRGVIAQEAQHLFPHAVSMHPNGYLLVDYGRIA
jgi:endosialidase-like protein